MRIKGFTLIELLIVILIIGLVSIFTIPIVVNALQERSVVNGATLLQAALVGCRDRAINSNAPAGIRLLPDPALSGALNRWIETETPQSYSEGLCRIDPGPFPLTLPSPVLTLEQALRDSSGLLVAPTSWFWCLRVGERVHIGTGEYTIVGPEVVQNSERFINVGPPGTVSPLDRGSGPVDFLWLVNGIDDDHDGYIDNGYDGITTTFEAERWLGNLGQGIESFPYKVTRRPAPSSRSGVQLLPAGCVIDITSRDRSRLPTNTDQSVDLLVLPTGQIAQSQVYSSPSSISMDGSFYHFWLAERGDVGLPVKGTARLISLNGRTGKLSVSDPVGSNNPQIEAQR